MALNTVHARLFVYHAPEQFRIDYKSLGSWEDTEGWVTFDDNNYLIKALPHENTSTTTIFELTDYEYQPLIRANFKQKFSWERSESLNMPGKVYLLRPKYDFPSASFKFAYKQFRGHPFYFLNFTEKNVWMANPFNLKFPKAVQHMRFRFSGNGQISQAKLMWYTARYGEMFGVKNRTIVLKSKFTTPQNLPYCIVDSRPNDSSNDRNALVQVCTDAVLFDDARE